MAASSNSSEFPFNDDFELKLGSSFHSKGGPKMAFHTIRYDFKPASVDTSRPAELVVGEKDEITVTVPHVQDSGTTVYRGSKRSCTKEFILVVDKEKKTFTLERIESAVPQLKKVRPSTKSAKPVKLPVKPSTATLTKLQKTKTKKKPVEKKLSKKASPVKNPNLSTSTPNSQETSAKLDDTAPAAELDSSSSSSCDSSDSEKDENEDEFDEDVEKLNSLMGDIGDEDILTKKEGFNTLCEDLQLSESGSDSD
ncbi:unnamed protein product [Porites evermanni]|uniref:Transcription elongation factor Eaf N-terminal domain-containing protein n=1 Tax=Porites evermanni TaxID=104178 RepID=A0ABN8S5P5_9CNID|nr:unnamed protein product [Porites evermanni]